MAQVARWTFSRAISATLHNALPASFRNGRAGLVARRRRGWGTTSKVIHCVLLARRMLLASRRPYVDRIGRDDRDAVTTNAVEQRKPAAI